MARKPSEMKEHAARIEALEAEVRGLRQVLTPHMELGLAVNRMRQRARGVPARTLHQTLARELRQVRRERARRAR